jgi:uncharacterized integral membrane protein
MADQQPQPPPPRPSRSHQARVIGAVVLAALLLVFAIQNTRRIRVDFLFVHRDSRVIYVIIASAIAGAVAGALVRRQRRRGQSR